MPSAFLRLALIAALLGLAHTAHVVYETSEKLGNLSCFSNQTTVIIRGYLQSGMVDPNLSQNAALLRAAGLGPIPYINPCAKCGKAKAQVTAMLAAMGKSPAFSDRIRHWRLLAREQGNELRLPKGFSIRAGREATQSVRGKQQVQLGQDSRARTDSGLHQGDDICQR